MDTYIASSFRLLGHHSSLRSCFPYHGVGTQKGNWGLCANRVLIFCTGHLLQQLQHCTFSPVVYSSPSALPASLATFCLCSTLSFTNSCSVHMIYKRIREVRYLSHSHTAKSPAGASGICCNLATPTPPISTLLSPSRGIHECLLGTRLCPFTIHLNLDPPRP